MKLTKIDVAEAQIRAAVWMFFRGEHPVPVYTLANAAREIVDTVGEQIDVETVQKELAAARGVAVKELVRPLVTTANFFKHADRDADATLDFDSGRRGVGRYNTPCDPASRRRQRQEANAYRKNFSMIDAADQWAALSANRSDHVSPTQVEHVRLIWAACIDLIVDGGATRSARN
jgi:hypothetical protein